MPETQTYYQEGVEDYSYATGLYNNYPVMRDVNNFAAYRSGGMSFVNYFNQWAPRRTVNEDFIDRNIQLLAIPNTIFPKRITSGSQVPPALVQTEITQLNNLNQSGTFQGDKFRWYGTLQQIRLPVITPFMIILGRKSWVEGGYHFPVTASIAADESARVGDTSQTAGIVMTNVQNRRAQGTVGTTTNSLIDVVNGGTAATSTYADQYTLTTSNQIVTPSTQVGYVIDQSIITWDEQRNQPQLVTQVFQSLKFPLLLSPQFKPWVCFRLITLKFKVSMNDWFNMASELPYRLNTLFWNKQDNNYNQGDTIYSQWDRATVNSVLAKPNPYGGTFKICKNKKIFVNPFKGKTITNWIYSKKRGKIINAKMWQPGQAPIAGYNNADYAQMGYYSNGLYVSLLLAPMNLERDFDSFSAAILLKYFTAVNGKQSGLAKGSYLYQWDRTADGSTMFYQKRALGRNIPGFPEWTAGLEVPYGIQLYNAEEILIKTQTKYCEY